LLVKAKQLRHNAAVDVAGLEQLIKGIASSYYSAAAKWISKKVLEFSSG